MLQIGYVRTVTFENGNFKIDIRETSYIQKIFTEFRVVITDRI